MFTSMPIWNSKRAKKVVFFLGAWIVLANVLGFYRLFKLQAHVEYLPSYYIPELIVLNTLKIFSGVLLIRISRYGFYLYGCIFCYILIHPLIAEKSIFVWNRSLFGVIVLCILYFQFSYLKKHSKNRNKTCGSVEPPF